MSEMSDEELLDAFVRTHGNHYRIRAKLGEGGSGTTYLADDLRRGIDVCVKVYRIARPELVRRDWYITSTLKSDFLADTFTVESVDQGHEVTACVSRYIPGANLQTFLNRFRELEPEWQRELRPVLMREVALDLCDAVIFCHRNGYGHGDLTTRNVVVTSPPRQGGHRFGVVMIDFDNQSHQADPSPDETARKESDIRALRTLLGSLTLGTVRHGAIQRLLAEMSDAGEIRNALQAGLQLFGDGLEPLDRERLPHDFWYLCARDCGLWGGDLLRNEVARLAEELNCTTEWEEGKERWRNWFLTEGRYKVTCSGTGTFTSPTALTAIARLLGQ